MHHGRHFATFTINDIAQQNSGYIMPEDWGYAILGVVGPGPDPQRWAIHVWIGCSDDQPEHDRREVGALVHGSGFGVHSEEILYTWDPSKRCCWEGQPTDFRTLGFLAGDLLDPDYEHSERGYKAGTTVVRPRPTRSGSAASQLDSCVPVQGLQVDLDDATIGVSVDGEWQGLMVQPAMEGVARLEGPLRWAADLYYATVKIDGESSDDD